MNHIKQGKEFLYRDGYETYRYLINKVIKNPQGLIVAVSTTTLDYFRKVGDQDPEIFRTLEPCITNTEFFIMYTNWRNFRYGKHQDLEYANTLRQEIINVLKKRGHVKEGDGKFEDYDDKALERLVDNT